MDINRGPNATAEGEFTDGDAQLGVPRSLLASKFMNMLLREGKNLVEKAGLALDELDEEQWYKAILAIRDENLFVNAGNPAFGATGDGVTDDTAAVQAAIDSIVSEQGFVIIPRNVPYIYADLVVPVGIYIFDIAAGRVLLSDVAYEKGVFNDQVIFRNAKADTPTRVYIMPRGAVPAGAVAAFKLFATDYTANQADYADFGLYYDVTDDVFRINSKNNGATSNKPMEVTFQDGSRTACTFFQGDDGGSLYAGIVFGGRLVDVDALTKFSIVPLIFAQSAAFANGKALRWYNAAGTSASAGMRMNATDDLEINDENGVAHLKLTAAGHLQQGTAIVTNSVVATDSDATPSVANTNFLRYPTTGAATITNLDDGVTGQEVTIAFSNAGYTVQHNANLKLAGGVDFVPNANDTITLIKGSSVWLEKCRSVNG